MNRNSTAILATAIFFSMLASSGVRPNTPDRSGNTHRAAPSIQTRVKEQAPKSADVEKTGESDYRGEMDHLLEQYCQDGTEQKKCSLQDENFVVAIVPDPVHTHLALYFDRTIDTIEEALQDDGYIFYQAIVPWDQETHPESDDFTLRLTAKRYQGGKEHLPGVMLFRPSGDLYAPKDPLIVMLVGENPTGGVEEEQFSNAIHQILDRTGTKRKDELSLRILGPTFSGSLSSLKRLLTCEKIPCYKKTTILSGTISGRDAVDDFQQTLKNFQIIEPGPPKITFDTFQESDRVMLERFIEFIARDGYGNRNYPVSHIAELSEDETAYGSMRHSAIQFAFPDVLQLYFPREISQLRAAYQDNSAAGTGADRLPIQALPHNYGVTGADGDTVASFSQKQTPLSQEAVLLSIVTELRKHAIEFVVLNATDPLDTLFLSHYLRKAYPQGRIVTINADMLFPREVEDTSLHGILAISTYSVAPSANHQFHQLWQTKTERMFPSSSEIGTYNAMHSLITAEVSTPLYTCIRSEAENECTDRLWSRETILYLIQYGWRERGHGEFSKYHAPPVRISALGHDGYWPLANLGQFKGEKFFTMLPQAVDNPKGTNDPQAATALPVSQFTTDPARLEVPDSWIVMEVVGLTLACGFCVCLWFASVRSPWQQLAQFAPTMARARVWLIAAAGVFLICVLLILLWPFVHGHGDWVMTHRRSHALALTLGIVAVVIVTLLDLSERNGLLDVVAQRRKLLWSDLRNRPEIKVFAASILLALAFFFLPEYSHEKLAGVRHFEVLRAIQLTSGLSPILPVFFLLAAGLWWANHASSGWTLLDQRRPRLPSKLQQPRIGGDEEIAKDLLKAVRPGFSSITHYLVLVVIALGVFLLTGLTLSPIRTIEPSRFDRYQLLPLLVIASAGLIGTTLRLWAIWFKARQLLLALDSSLLRRGFQRLEGFSWKPIWKFGGGGALDEYQRLLSRQREALQSAANVSEELKNSKRKTDLALGQTRSAYKAGRALQYPLAFPNVASLSEDKVKAYIRNLFSLKKWAESRKAEQRLIKQFGGFQRGIAVAAHDAMVYLTDRWQREEEEPKRHRGQESADELKTRACERFVALVYVSFLLVVLARMRTLIIAISGMYILILLALTLYPFEPRPAIQIYLVVMLVFIVTVVGLVFAQIHRDATLSHITDTKPGELGGDFYLRMASFVALPLFTFFASQFPEIGRSFYSWLEPALQALNR